MVVTSQASLLNTENANIAADIDAKQVVELPLNLRNVYGLATLNSSVNNTSEGQMLLGGGGPSTDNADQDISFLNFAGGFFGTSAFLLDGVWDTDPEWGAVDLCSIGGLGVGVQGPEQLLHSAIRMEYRQCGQRRYEVRVRAGFMATPTSSIEIDALDANLWFNNHNGIPRQNFNRNQYGVSAGDRSIFLDVYKQHNKTFIFGLYERLTLATPTLVSSPFPRLPPAGNFAGHFAEVAEVLSAVLDALGRPISLARSIIREARAPSRRTRSIRRPV